MKTKNFISLRLQLYNIKPATVIRIYLLQSKNILNIEKIPIVVYSSANDKHKIYTCILYGHQKHPLTLPMNVNGSAYCSITTIQTFLTFSLSTILAASLHTSLSILPNPFQVGKKLINGLLITNYVRPIPVCSSVAPFQLVEDLASSIKGTLSNLSLQQLNLAI